MQHFEYKQAILVRSLLDSAHERNRHWLLTGKVDRRSLPVVFAPQQDIPAQPTDFNLCMDIPAQFMPVLRRDNQPTKLIHPADNTTFQHGSSLPIACLMYRGINSIDMCNILDMTFYTLPIHSTFVRLVLSKDAACLFNRLLNSTGDSFNEVSMKEQPAPID